MSEEKNSAGTAPQTLPENTILFGKYRVLAPINLQGGTAFLYRAVNIRTDQIVALKEFFPKGYCQREENMRISPPKESEKRKTYENARKMFEREAALLKENQDDGVILKYYDMFHANGTIYYAMEYLEGESLKEYLKKKEKMELPEALTLLEPIFDALVILHQKQVLHRDISPDNIFLCKNGSVRLIDFGNARVQEKGKSRILDWAKMGYAPVEMQSDDFP